MIKTLRGLKRKVLKNPENYGKDSFFTIEVKPNCPIAVEILPDPYDENFYIEKVAKRLNCTREQVWDFINAWDNGKLKDLKV